MRSHVHTVTLLMAYIIRHVNYINMILCTR